MKTKYFILILVILGSCFAITDYALTEKSKSIGVSNPKGYQITLYNNTISVYDGSRFVGSATANNLDKRYDLFDSILIYDNR